MKALFFTALALSWNSFAQQNEIRFPSKNPESREYVAVDWVLSMNKYGGNFKVNRIEDAYIKASDLNFDSMELKAHKEWFLGKKYVSVCSYQQIKNNAYEKCEKVSPESIFMPTDVVILGPLDGNDNLGLRFQTPQGQYALIFGFNVLDKSVLVLVDSNASMLNGEFQVWKSDRLPPSKPFDDIIRKSTPIISEIP